MKELQIIRESIQEVTGVDIMINSKRRKVVDAKALFYYFAKETARFSRITVTLI